MTRPSFNAATAQGPHNTFTDTWITPKWIIDKIGLSDLDLCGFLLKGKPIVETAHHYFTEEQDGFSQKWFGRVFVNFPYSESKKWFSRCAEYSNGIVLCFARTDTQAWQKFVKTATGVNFINRRVSFLNAAGVEQSNGNAPSALIAWGEENFQRICKVDGIRVRIELTIDDI